MAYSRIVLIHVALAAVAFSQGPAVPGKVDSVTLFRGGQALVTRTLTIDGPAGAREVVVSGLPDQVVPSSLFAESVDGLEVRAVRFRSSAVSEEPREAVREIDAKLQLLAEKIAAVAKGQELVQRRLASLEKLENFVAPAATAEMSKGILNPEALERLVLFNFDQRKKATEESLTLAKESRDLEAQSNLLTRQRAELAQGTTKTVREGVLFVEKRRAEPTPLRVSYLVNGCGWAPTYNFRTGGDMTSVDVECNALIHQMSGEDWAGVELTLSTASPGLNAAAPAMAPFAVSLRPALQTEAQAAAKTDPGSVVGQFNDLRSRRQVAVAANRAALNPSDNLSTSFEMNAVANAGQAMELLERREILQSLNDEATATVEGPSLTYPLETRVSLASRDEQQLVRITAVKLKSTAYFVASPVLTGFVYREAELVNSSPLDLLGGPMSVYLDGSFVGRGEIDSVAHGQTFVVGFGVDPQVRTRREQVDKSEKIQGGNKMSTLKYRLVIENYKSTPVTVRLHDRLPHADRTESLSVTLGEMNAKLSEDPSYLRLGRPMGILRWDLSVPAAANGEKAFFLNYTYTVEHDRNLGLSAPPMDGGLKAQQEFERLLKQRQGK